MGYPLYAHHKTHKHGKTSNILSDIIVLNAYKLSLKFFRLSTIGENLNQSKCPRLLQPHVEGSSLR
ncbi:hypothetical protein [Trichodesmium erythraeum]|uniref:hypothetical protein n=1 Tax=Trichodesmium erythraeum TaxID=1206 RepID=UPI0018C8C570|nr:hypothetical protein [Trichodesmium sp. St11_bin5]MDT9339188.1 hypothetical protein [Trichodesmium erythraeum 21-75]